MVKKINLLVLSVITFFNITQCLNFDSKKIIAFVTTSPLSSLIVPQKSISWLAEELARYHDLFSKSPVHKNSIETVIIADPGDHAQTNYLISLDPLHKSVPRGVHYLITITALKNLTENDRSLEPERAPSTQSASSHGHRTSQQEPVNEVRQQHQEKENKFKLFLETHCKHYLPNNIKSVLAMKSSPSHNE